MRNTRISTLIPIVLAATLFSGCSSGGTAAEETAAPAPEPTIELLSASKAGGVYLSAVCPVNAAWDALDVEVDRLRIAVARGENDTSRFAEAMLEVAQASGEAAKRLSPKGQSWPTEAKTAITRVQRTLTADQKQAGKVAKLDAAAAAEYEWDDAESAGAAAGEAREALGLPADPVQACAQWEKQEAAAGTNADDRSAEPGTADSDTVDSRNQDSGPQPE